MRKKRPRGGGWRERARWVEGGREGRTERGNEGNIAQKSGGALFDEDRTGRVDQTRKKRVIRATERNGGGTGRSRKRKEDGGSRIARTRRWAA